MFFEDLQDLFVVKASLVGLQYNGVVLEFPQDDGLPLRSFTDKDNNLVVSIRNVTSMPKETLSTLVENQVCLRKNQKEGIMEYYEIGKNIPAHAEVYKNIHDAFVEYFAGKLHIKAFGQENFERYRQWGLQDRLMRVDYSVQKADLLSYEKHGNSAVLQYLDLASQITSLFPDQMRETLSTTKKELPRVIREVTAHFPKAFEMINAFEPQEGQVASVKAQLVALLTQYMLENVDLVQSYRGYRILFFPPDTINLAARVDVRDDETQRLLTNLHCTILETYQKQGQQYELGN